MLLYFRQENTYGGEQAVKDDSQVGGVQKLTQSEQSRPGNTTDKAPPTNMSATAYNTQQKQCKIVQNGGGGVSRNLKNAEVLSLQSSLTIKARML
jgi:hypothetical protein